MKQKLKLVKVDDLVCDETVYPRNQTNWVNISRYKHALKSGAVFPLITVAVIGKKVIVVDGFHRLEARKANGETHVQVEVLPLNTMQEVYIESVKRNIAHGQQLSGQERAKIVLTLENWGKSQLEISEIVRIPLDKLSSFVADRSARVGDTQEDVILKSPLKHLTGIEFESQPDQKVFSNQNQAQILDSLISLLKNKWIDDDSELIMEKLGKIYKLLETYNFA